MLWVKALHLIFMVTWFAGLLLFIPDIGLPDRVRGRMSTNKVRTRSPLTLFARVRPWTREQAT